MAPSLLAAIFDATDLTDRQMLRESAVRTHSRQFPIVPVHAYGMSVEGADGRMYLDCLSGAGTLALGHNHPVVAEAIRPLLGCDSAPRTLDPGMAARDDFTSALLESLPPGLARDARVRFCGPAGSDAMEVAVKLAQAATGREGLLAFTGAYHGMTGPAPTVAGLPFPYPYRCPFGVGGEQGTRLGLRHIESVIDDASDGAPSAAALLVEPVQGEGGVLPAPDHWMREVRRITAERGIALIADEVQTGVGRTGKFWAVEHSGVTPDVMVLSKAIGGSLPLAAIVYRGELDAHTPRANTHPEDFHADQLAMAAGAATLRFVAEADLSRRAGVLGDRMLRELRLMAADRPCVGEVRGRGLMIGLELVDPDAGPDALGARPPAPALAALARTACLNRGLIVELGGRSDCVLRLLPPLIMTDAEADEVVARLSLALADAQRELRESE